MAEAVTKSNRPVIKRDIKKHPERCFLICTRVVLLPQATGTHRYLVVNAETEGFEPSRPFNGPTSLAVRRFRPTQPRLRATETNTLFMLFLYSVRDRESDNLARLRFKQNSFGLRKRGSSCGHIIKKNDTFTSHTLRISY